MIDKEARQLQSILFPIIFPLIFILFVCVYYLREGVVDLKYRVESLEHQLETNNRDYPGCSGLVEYPNR